MQKVVRYRSHELSQRIYGQDDPSLERFEHGTSYVRVVFSDNGVPPIKSIAEMVARD